MQVLDEEGGVENTNLKETQMTSDRDSGTGDEIFSTESTVNGGEQQQVNPTPTTMDTIPASTSETDEPSPQAESSTCMVSKLTLKCLLLPLALEIHTCTHTHTHTHTHSHTHTLTCRYVRTQ